MLVISINSIIPIWTPVNFILEISIDSIIPIWPPGYTVLAYF